MVSMTIEIFRELFLGKINYILSSSTLLCAMILFLNLRVGLIIYYIPNS